MKRFLFVFLVCSLSFIATIFIRERVQAQTAPTPIFSDDFNGTTLNSVWTNGLYWWGTGITGAGIGEQENYMPSQATVANGYLHLTAINEASGGRPYTSGLVTTGGVKGKTPVGFSFLYGYAEAKIKLPSGNGMWPAFWLYPADYNDPPEIDILENLGKQITVYYATLHNPANGSQVQYTKTVPDLSQDFHVYAVDWQPGYLDFYFDGTKIAHYADTASYFTKAMYPIFNVALGGSWAGPVDTTKLPATMLVDWVHVYKMNPYTGPTSTSVAPSASPTPTRTVGDANNDGKVDEMDYAIWLGHYGQRVTIGPSGGDFNNDSVVDGVDYVLWATNYGI